MPWTADHDRVCLTRALDRFATDFDEVKSLLRAASGATYHTKLRGVDVHPLRESAGYALALLDAGDEALVPRAEAILREVLRHQDVEPESRTYGIWPYYAEEPLVAMATPDFNWADFLGERLVAVLQRHAVRLDRELCHDIGLALRHAGVSIRRRDVQPGYTNICALGAYVTLAIAELFRDQGLKKYALQRLRRFADDVFHTRGSFAEYNSPTYAVVTITALTRLAEVAEDPTALTLARRVLERAWRHVMDHWHPPTRQWAGPHSRCYQTDLRDNPHVRLVLQKASDGRIEFYDLDDLPGDATVATVDFTRFATIPEAALELPEPRSVVEVFEPAGEQTQVISGTTWHHPAVTLGTVTRANLWNQRRPLLAYWGEPDRVGHLRLQALRDGRDFASAQFFSFQETGFAAGVVNFADDGGDWHPSLDPIRNKRFKVQDLRLRFRLTNVPPDLAESLEWDLGTPAVVALGEVQLRVAVIQAVFGTEPPRWEITPLDDGVGLDLVWFRRDVAKEIGWEQVGEAWAAFAIRILPAGEDDHGLRVSVKTEDDAVVVRGDSGELRFTLRAGRELAPQGVQQAAYRCDVAKIRPGE